MEELRNSELGGERVCHRSSNGIYESDGRKRLVGAQLAPRRLVNGNEGDLNNKVVSGGNDPLVADVDINDATQKQDRTLQEFYEQEEFFEEDDDDDSDWEPTQKNILSEKWFCTNCTMGNREDVLHCNVCGEYKDSEILKHGFFAPHFALGAHSRLRSEVLDKFQVHLESHSAETTSSSCTAMGFDERMLLHFEVENKPHPHPERPDRLRVILASLKTAGIFPEKCIQLPAREINKDELRKVHSLEHIEAVEQTSSMLTSYFTPDTYANEHSAQAARLAAGICADLASAIMSGHAKNGFALVRPPGHHAGVHQAMGFCLHNNAAVAVLAAKASNAKKVLIVDWDVHHGNGTQEIFEGDRSVLYVSLHRHEGGWFYPGTGAVNEVGSMGAEGYCVNIPWKCGGVGDVDYIFAFQHIVLPIAREFAPDLTIISAGFDAARGDPLGGCDVTPSGYAQMTHMLGSLSGGKLLVILEGGYNLRSISSSATAVIRVLLGEDPRCEMSGIVPSKVGLQAVLEVLKVQLSYWTILEPSYMVLLSQWKLLYPQPRNKLTKKRKQRVFMPYWWRWGRKSMLYYLFRGTW